VNVPTEHLLILAALLFALGVLGFLVRRNVIIVLASIELMLNAANLSFLAASRHWSQTALAGRGDPSQGPIFALFVILVAAAEAAVGLALVIALYRTKQTVALDRAAELKG
jgi:NADH-quinone oxidoreductase subunit K